MSDCLFCKIIEGKIPSKKVFEDDRLFAMEDVNPQAPVHLLIMPKKHVATLLDLQDGDSSLMGAVFPAASRLARERNIDRSGFRLVVNCGAGAGQSVFHIHFHLLGGRAMLWPPG
ncbi:MAG: histidine triad nucleotide-binding protein [Nitrospinae bacterium]|nr:histidine triad nucleotide-binding protein [Nitrospinota bacterium]